MRGLNSTSILPSSEVLEAEKPGAESVRYIGLGQLRGCLARKPVPSSRKSPICMFGVSGAKGVGMDDHARIQMDEDTCPVGPGCIGWDTEGGPVERVTVLEPVFEPMGYRCI